MIQTANAHTTAAFEALKEGTEVPGQPFAVTRETIRAFCEGSLDFNPLHLDDDYMKGSFGKTSFGGIIMHGMSNFGLLSRMLTDWLYPVGGVHRRLETRWLAPVRPGDTITPGGRVKYKRSTEKSRWALVDVAITNQRGEKIAQGEAMVEFPLETAGSTRTKETA
jgi:3-hydroxybutyryl-CoA dehydratase